MGAKKKRDPDRKTGPQKLSDLVTGLAESDPTAISRVRAVASALDLEKFVDFLDASEDVMSSVRELLNRSENRFTLSEAATRAGVPEEQLTKLNLACGFANPEPDARVLTEEDIEVMQMFQASAEIFGEELAVQNVRVIGQAMSRVADAFISNFATIIGRRSREGEFTDEDLMRTNETAIALLPSAVRAMDVLLRRHIEFKSRASFLTGKDWEGVDAVDRAIAFCDLVGYTSLAARTADTKLASILLEFETTASDLITERGASLVKLIGDEVMFVAPNATVAADVALTLSETFNEHDLLPPVRCGLATGRVIVREGDYHGPVVNLAARIVKVAPPGGVVAPRYVVDELGTVKAEDVGTQKLKGFEKPVELVRLLR